MLLFNYYYSSRPRYVVPMGLAPTFLHDFSYDGQKFACNQIGLNIQDRLKKMFLQIICNPLQGLNSEGFELNLT